MDELLKWRAEFPILELGENTRPRSRTLEQPNSAFA
jgi:hypothetical protein